MKTRAFIRTGSLGLDLLLKGGWQRGSTHEIWGGPGSAKSTVAETAILGLDPGEHAMWMSLGTEIPHRPTGAAVCQPRNAEQAFYIMEMALIGSVSLIVVDSANGLIRKRELDGDPDYVPHPQREYKDELTSLNKICRARGGTVLFLSKPRARDRQPVRGTGISEKARSRVELKIIQHHQDESRLIEARVRGTDDPAEFTVRPGTGIDWSLELAHLTIKHGIAERKGSWIELEPGPPFHGIEAFAAELEDNVQLAVALDEQVREHAGL